jgi:hypothetical protein
MAGIQMHSKMTRFIGLLTCAALSSTATAGPDKAVSSNTAAARPVARSSPYKSAGLPESAKLYYLSSWGVDSLKAVSTASGNLIRFSYRVVQPKAATALGDVTSTPYMVGLKNNAVLHIPVMEKVGQLRQTGVPQQGQEYWMAFSNKGAMVMRGDRVNVVIGTFHVDGLTVE